MIVKEGMYTAPAAKTVEISAQGIICGSPMQGNGTESYEDGDTSGWYGNN